MKKRDFSVIIPTRERPDTLEMALRSVTNQDYDNLEIIVSDNFSCDATEDIVRAANDKRIRYVNTGKRVSMSENWEFALTHVTGEWLTIIGDDDALLPGCLEKINKLADETGVEAIRTSTCDFAWPSLAGTKSGQLMVPMGSGLEIRDCNRWLAKVLSGEEQYTVLPMLYNGGFVAFDALRRVRAKDGRFYHSCQPDVFSAILLSQVLTKYAYSYDPVAINGASIHSIGTSTFKIQAKAESELLPAAKFRSESNIPLHPDIPLQPDGDLPKSIQALVYESYLQVSEILPSSKKLDRGEQLKVILASAGSHYASIYNWGKNFAELHGLNFSKISTQAKRYSRKLRIDRLRKNIVRVLNTYSLDSNEIPIRDVYQASIAAALIRVVRPLRVKTIMKTVHARIQRMVVN